MFGIKTETTNYLTKKLKSGIISVQLSKKEKGLL